MGGNSRYKGMESYVKRELHKEKVSPNLNLNSNLNFACIGVICIFICPCIILTLDIMTELSLAFMITLERIFMIRLLYLKIEK